MAFWQTLFRQSLLTIFLIIRSYITQAELETLDTVELRWLEPFWDHENLFETAVVRATEGYY